MRIFVAGGTGAIGRFLIPLLVQAGHQVTATTRSPERLPGLREAGAEGVVLALNWPSGPVNVVDDEPAPAREWVPVLAEALDRPAPEPTSGREAWERGASNAYAKEIGWTPSHPTWRTGFFAAD